MTDLFLGEFEVAGKIYEVIEEDYLEVPDELDNYEIITRAAKQLAIARTAKVTADKNRLPENERLMRSSVDDPVQRFTGTVLIYDATNLAYRCAFSFPPLNSPSGERSEVVYGVLKTLASNIRNYQDVVSVIMCWDMGIPQFRKEASPEYKATRKRGDDKSTDDFDYRSFINQCNILHKILPSFGVVSARKNDTEADDLVYAASRLFNGDTLNVVISTDDDLLQCVNYHTVVWSPVADKTYSLTNFKDMVGVVPKDYLCYKSMVGDGSDNLAGIYGIGHKTAVKLIEEFAGSPSYMVNTANGEAPGPELSKSVSKKLREFGLVGFRKMYRTMRLHVDFTGSKYHLFRNMKAYKPYNPKEVTFFLKKNAFVSLMDPMFYEVFKALRSPASRFKQEIGTKVRFPKINLVRTPSEPEKGN